jgi:hypothetical protein
MPAAKLVVIYPVPTDLEQFVAAEFCLAVFSEFRDVITVCYP